MSSDFKLLHTMFRVIDINKSINFYTKFLNMKLIRKNDYPGGKFTLAFVMLIAFSGCSSVPMEDQKLNDEGLQ